jgi:hypothetical protein
VFEGDRREARVRSQILDGISPNLDDASDPALMRVLNFDPTHRSENVIVCGRELHRWPSATVRGTTSCAGAFAI